MDFGEKSAKLLVVIPGDAEQVGRSGEVLPVHGSVSETSNAPAVRAGALRSAAEAVAAGQPVPEAFRPWVWSALRREADETEFSRG